MGPVPGPRGGTTSSDTSENISRIFVVSVHVRCSRAPAFAFAHCVHRCASSFVESFATAHVSVHE